MARPASSAAFCSRSRARTGGSPRAGTAAGASVAASSRWARACSKGAWRCRRCARRGSCSGVAAPNSSASRPTHWARLRMSCCQYSCTWARCARATATAWVRSRMRESQVCANTSSTASASTRASSVRATSAQRSSIWQSGPALSVWRGQCAAKGCPHWPRTASPNHSPSQAMPAMPERSRMGQARSGQRSGCMSAGRASSPRRMRCPRCHTAQAASSSTSPRATSIQGSEFMLSARGRGLAALAAGCRTSSCGSRAARAPAPGHGRLQPH